MSGRSQILQEESCRQVVQRTSFDERIRLIWFKHFLYMMKAFLYNVAAFCLSSLLGSLFSTNSVDSYILFLAGSLIS